MSRLNWLTAAMVVGAAVYAGPAMATPAVGFTSTTLATATYEEIDVKASSHPEGEWQAKLKTHGASDLYVQSNLWVPGGTSGWHTHPGFSLITVTSGTVTAYHGDDPTCTPHVYTAGMGFIDRGGDHVHLIRNEGAVEARSITVQLIPDGAARRIDVTPAPGNCGF